MKQNGFTYVGLLIAVAVMAAGATAALGAGAALQQRWAEEELLAIGMEFRHALQSYAAATPQGLPTNPKELAELLRDPRHPGVVRHLRRLYPDPLTGKAEWGIERGPDGRIVGVHSQSPTETLRRTDFPRGLEALEDQSSHDKWIFTGH